ncbi:hypothetical protein A2210_00110 [Candidatus Woesebacteria bacterium RIFOXYA1_FULL_40_18]|uniref:Uncharacterized protein n=1 Tax=Candidatus Woesebacteria bacterium RIFOXYA1_FULL_40_18 TaxID=1802532 RepID=A0A1F8CMF0_9BACT|nr:MAG: hypothetical protein A2210_00110 [Candidatus Woesebacteria bacterium RIFOXYA1_FULL_40_18]
MQIVLRIKFVTLVRELASLLLVPVIVTLRGALDVRVVYRMRRVLLIVRVAPQPVGVAVWAVTIT